MHRGIYSLLDDPELSICFNIFIGLDHGERVS